MSIGLSFADLIAYTDWERDKWEPWFERQDDTVLSISVGPHGDGRFQTIGDVIRHIFSAEKRYIDRLSNRPLTDPASIPGGGVLALFEFGRQSRADLKHFVSNFPMADWEVQHEYTLMNNTLRATPKKIIAHVLLHEIRHWAQIATLLRLNGFSCEMHDFLFSPVFGGEFRKAS